MRFKRGGNLPPSPDETPEPLRRGWGLSCGTFDAEEDVAREMYSQTDL